jgi:type IV pilus assembly protein PilM
MILDCGASRTALGIFSQQGGRIRLDNYAVEIFPAPPVGERDWLEQTQAAFVALRRRVKASGPVSLVLPAHLALLKGIRTPRVPSAQRAKVVQFEAEQGIPYALADVVWDHVIAAEDGQGADGLLAAAKLDVVGPLCEAAGAAGFAPRMIVPSPFATLAAFQVVRSSDEPVLVLNVGVRSTTLLLVEGTRFAARTLAVGSQTVALPDAGGSGGEDTGPAAALATRLAQEVTRSVLHFRRVTAWPDPTRVHLAEGGARLEWLGEELAIKLQMPVERLDVGGAIELGSESARHDAAAGSLTDLVGAAATQLRPGQPVANLLPRAWREGDAQRRRAPWLAAAAVLAVAALVPPVLHFRAVAAEADRMNASIEAELVPLRERDGRNRANLQRLEELRAQVAALQGIHDRRTAWLDFLGDVQERLVQVEDVWFERMSVVSPPGSPLRLAVSGRMLDKTNPLSKVSPETFHRVKTLLASIVDSPFVAAVEGERFDNMQPGILKFDFVLVADPARPL